ncbi:MAG TPA: hypothetical protein VGC54_09405 [Planctomycetota bacterium]
MAPTPIRCAHCDYEICSYSEALEALEGGAACLLCGGALDAAALAAAADSWTDAELLAEGTDRAATEADVDDDEDLFEGVLDFGDEGEDEEDPVF